jgi:outer membrane protein X
MKKFIIMAIVALSAVFNAHAEAGDMSIAPQISFATKNSLFGVGAQVQFDIDDHFRLAPDFFFFIKNKGKTAYSADVNLHYVIPKGNFAFYPIAGVAYHRYKFEKIDEEGEKYDEKHDRIGGNIGIGAQYEIDEIMQLFAEERFQLMKSVSQSVTVLGVRFVF